MAVLTQKSGLDVIRSAPSLREQTLKALREAIIEMRFQPGQRLVEREICAQTNVSRSCVREALRCLESEGLVQTIPNKGPVVAVVTLAEVASIYEVRRALEILVCGLFTERATADETKQLVVCVDHLERAMKRKDLTASLKANGDFYEILVIGSRNEVAAALSRTLRARVTYARSAMTSQWNVPRFRKSIERLRAIAVAAQKRDVKAAQRKMEEHIDESAKIALAILADKSPRH